MKGHGPYSKILNWIQSEHAKSEFVPSVPPSPAALPEPRFQNLHRLTYHASGTLESPSSSPRVLKLEISLESRGLELDSDVAGSDVKHVPQASGTPQMWTGYQSEVDVLMPHRLDNAPIRHASSLTSSVDRWISDSPYKISPQPLMQPSLLFSNNTSPSWTHSERITIDPSSSGPNSCQQPSESGIWGDGTTSTPCFLPVSGSQL